jgi:isopropylmalate/homocitrate/citramalate synthase
VRGGATWIHGTINGMGERAGNADIAEVALALQCLYDVPVEMKLEHIRDVSEFVRRAGKYELEGWKPLIGENLFLRESGAVASQFHIPEAIEPYAAELVGAKRGHCSGQEERSRQHSVESGRTGARCGRTRSAQRFWKK